MRALSLLSLLMLVLTTRADADSKMKAHRRVSSAVDPATDQVAQPSLGWLAVSNPPELRPVLGFRSAARLGDAVPLPAGASAVYMAPGQNYVLVNGPDLLVLDLPSLETRSLGHALTSEPLFSPRGTSIAFPVGESRWSIRAGLPQDSSLISDLAVPPGAAVLAISDLNDLAYELEGRLYLLNAQNTHSIALDKPAFLSFVPGSSEVIAALTAGDVVSISIGDSDLTLRRIAGSPRCEKELKGFIARDSEPELLLACATELTRIRLQTGASSTHTLLSEIGTPVALANGRSAISAGSSMSEAAEVISISGEATESFLIPAVTATSTEVVR